MSVRASGLQNLGPQALSNAELIAILLRVGVPGENAVQVGQRLLQQVRRLTGIHRAPFDELLHQHGSARPKPPRSRPPSNSAAG
jgi:DNA repair protein RadC